MWSCTLPEQRKARNGLALPDRFRSLGTLGPWGPPRPASSEVQMGVSRGQSPRQSWLREGSCPELPQRPVQAWRLGPTVCIFKLPVSAFLSGRTRCFWGPCFGGVGLSFLKAGPMQVFPSEGSVRIEEPLLSLTHWELGGPPTERSGLSLAEAVALSRAQVLPAQVTALEKRPGLRRLCCDPGVPLPLPQASPLPLAQFLASSDPGEACLGDP